MVMKLLELRAQEGSSVAGTTQEQRAGSGADGLRRGLSEGLGFIDSSLLLMHRFPFEGS